MKTIPLEICILAAGVGSRMRSDKPKVLQTLAGKPFLAHLLDTVARLSPDNIHVVIGQGAEAVKQAFAHRSDINWVYQHERLGTGHAMQQVAPHLRDDSRVLVLLGDAPLITPATLQDLVSLDAALAVLTVDMPEPFNYGRIVRDGNNIVQIVEERDATPAQQAISEINTGVMCADAVRLKTWLGLLDDNNQQCEYLLTDIVQHANAQDLPVAASKSDDPVEVTGVNTFAQLAKLERDYQRKLAQALMQQGVQLMDPARVDIRGELLVGRGVMIDVNVIFEGNVELGDGVRIGPNCVIINSRLGANCVVKANSVLEEAQLGADCAVGPFVRLRPGAELSDEVTIGNFVEVKKTKIGKGSKASHLTYLGDAILGEGVNIGAGTITCNYDGVNKSVTKIGDGAFIGSNTSLVAPVEVGEQATVGAGSTITKNVDGSMLAVARGKQVTIANWQKPTKKSPAKK